MLGHFTTQLSKQLVFAFCVGALAADKIVSVKAEQSISVSDDVS